ncbi:MAG: helix-turn-helix transcriptional regulator [Firmicutes bacterium]|nr:helix-turn-helix transcriptional regulator [Bacillota bacterium]
MVNINFKKEVVKVSFSRTELAKMGKYIAKLRKEKNYTQRQLGELIDIPYKTISKWENGVIAPDITVLQSLANVLNVTVDELLCGEKLKTVEEKNLATINGMKIYIKKSIGKILKIIVLFLVVLFVCITYFLSVENYYEWNVLDLNFSDEELVINGNIMFNRERTLIVLDEFAYISEKTGTSAEPKVKSMKISVFADGVMIAEKERMFDKAQFLHYCFDSYHFVFDGKDFYTQLIKEKIDISIVYTDTKNKEHSIILKMNS